MRQEKTLKATPAKKGLVSSLLELDQKVFSSEYSQPKPFVSDTTKMWLQTSSKQCKEIFELRKWDNNEVSWESFDNAIKPGFLTFETSGAIRKKKKRGCYSAAYPWDVRGYYLEYRKS